MRSLVVVLLLPLLGCVHHVALLDPSSQQGGEYDCVVGASPGNCVPAVVLVPGDNDRFNTAYVPLPVQCKGRYNRVIVHNSGSRTPTVRVICAPDENPL